METENTIAGLKHRDIVSVVQIDRKGLGFEPFKLFSATNERERRTAMSGRAKDLESLRRKVHLIQCAQQGQVVRWEEKLAGKKSRIGAHRA